MGVLTRATGHALADLAAALTAASVRIDAVLDIAARAGADLVGDYGAARLLGADGRYEAITVHGPDPGRARAIAEALGDPAEDGYLARLAATGEPVVLSPLTREAFDRLAPPHRRADFDRLGISACLLCPVIADGTYLGYLALARTAPDGSYTESDADLARDIAGEVALALNSARWIERLRASEERYRRVVETTLEGVWQLDADGATTFVNEPMAAMLGLPREQLIGQSVEDFLDKHGRAQLPRWLAECREGHPGVHQTRLVRPDGSTRSVQLATAPIPNESGDPGCALCMVSDVTDQVQARGLKRQLDHLRRLDSLGQLIGGIAHDFKNLLTVIAGSAEVIAGDAGAGSTQHHLATEIVSAATRGRTLAHQLLAFGRGGGQLETVALADLLEDVTQLLSRTLGEHIRLDVSGAPDLWAVRAERGPLEQVLINLAANGRDAMPRGGVLTVQAVNTTVEAGQVADSPTLAGRFVRLTVADTGAGMDEETRRRAVEPFFTTKPAAAGLGLATAASILRGGGAHLRLDSEPRMGTTVTVLLPAADRPAAPVPGPALAASPGPRHILVVEDQPELAELIRHLLEPAGHTVTVATDPRSAMTALPPEVQPDLLLTDVVMPGMTGPELAAALRERNADLRVLYMSGYAPSVLNAPAGAETDDLIQKPFNRQTLLAAVQRAWG